jgi:hypothetical protein
LTLVTLKPARTLIKLYNTGVYAEKHQPLRLVAVTSL